MLKSGGLALAGLGTAAAVGFTGPRLPRGDGLGPAAGAAPAAPGENPTPGSEPAAGAQ